MIVIGREAVAQHLSPERTISLVREAMRALSEGRTKQLLRNILFLGEGDAFGVMPGVMEGEGFGAKLVSVFPGNFAAWRPSHQGVVLLFDRTNGRPVCMADATEITALRTAAASAAATDALARKDARRLAILGYGEQAWRHAVAIPLVRSVESLRVWGRSQEEAAAFCRRAELLLGVAAEPAASPAEAVAGVDIICTTTAAHDPVLFSRDVADGAHVNLVGSSRAGPSEADTALVARARFFADHRDGVLSQGAEFLKAKAEGLVGDDHVLGGIGEVFAGELPGRTEEAQVTIYKSLGSIVQDIACAADLYRRAKVEGFGQAVSL